jgi:hypothetical protein
MHPIFSYKIGAPRWMDAQHQQHRNLLSAIERDIVACADLQN